MNEARAKRAERYLAEARSQAAGASKAAFVWALALVSIWLTAIEPLRDQQRLFQERQTALAITARVLTARRNSLLKSLRLDSVLTLSFSDNKTAYDSAIVQLPWSQAHEEDSLIQEARKVNFKIWGAELPIARQHAAAIWMLFFLGLFVYLLANRLRVLNLCGKAFRIYRDELRVPESELRDVMGSMPSWLAPLPAVDGAVSSKTLRSAFGWDRSYKVVLAILGALAIAAFLVEARVARIAFDSAIWFVDAQRWWVRSLVLVLAGATLILLWGWVRTLFVDSHFPDEAGPNAWRRRDVIVAGSIAIVFAALHPLRSAFERDRPQESRPRRPRFRVRAANRFRVDLDPGFYLNGSNKRILHYVPPSKVMAGVVYVNPRKLQVGSQAMLDVKVSTPEQPRVHLSTAVHALETEALRRVAAGQHAEAIKLLEAAIQHDLIAKKMYRTDAPSVRTYELLAGLSIRFESGRAALKALSESATLANHPSLQDRLRKWTNMDSRWSIRWSEKRPIRYSGLPM